MPAPPNPTTSPTAARLAHWSRPALVVLLLISIGWFAARGPVRALSGTADFFLFHAAARAWLAGSNPYLTEDVTRAWLAVGGDPAGDPAITRPVSSLIYAPPTFVVLAPLAALPQGPANLIWMGLNVGFLCFSLWAIGRIAGLEGRGRMVLWICGFFFAPAATSVYVGQLSLLVLALIAGGHLLRLRAARGGAPDTRGDWAAGALLGMAAIIKPQMGLLFLVYEAGRLRYRSVAGGLAAMGLLLLIGAGRLELAGIDWFDMWRHHLHVFASAGDGDASRANHMRYHLIHLAFPLHSLLEQREVVLGIVYAVLGGMSLAYFVIDLRRGRQEGEGHNELLSLSMTAVVSLLIAYHRAYDAVLLLFPLAMGLRGVRMGRHAEPSVAAGMQWPSRRGYAAVLVMLAPFALPGSIILYKMGAEWQVVPRQLADSLLWEAFIVPHATWLILLLGIWVTVMRARTGPARGG
jgi:hypothetical protein